jgi:hypothetical protein
MMRSGVILGFAAGVMVFFVPAAEASRAGQRAIHAGCPPSSAREAAAPAATVDQVVAAARSRVVGTIAHYQGRAERRTKLNTPVEAVVMYVGFSNLRDARALLRRARRRCGVRAARYSSAVLFHDGLSVIADATITQFVVKTGRGVWVYRA